jgi:hypothetical protein
MTSADLTIRPIRSFVAEFLDWSQNFRAYRARKVARKAARLTA